jgi:nucleotide-binding universal stress UspA family protein
LTDLEEPLGEGIVTGHPSMPEFRFEPDQIHDFIEFLKTLQRKRPPQIFAPDQTGNPRRLRLRPTSTRWRTRLVGCKAREPSMIKSILIPATGEILDDAILDTALRVAQLARAHIELHYFCEQLGGVADNLRHVGATVGGAVPGAVARVDQRAEEQIKQARARFADLCRRKGVALVEATRSSTSVTASWHALRDDLANPPYYAHHADLIVTSRSGHGNGLKRSHVETTLSGGRPVLITPSWARPLIAGTVFVCWKETAEAARALAAALPLLAKAQRVVVATMAEDANAPEQSLGAVARYLAFHGIAAESRSLPRGVSAADTLAAAAEAHEADLIVLGAYGHSKARQPVFGGCTRSFLNGAGLPVLMMR